MKRFERHALVAVLLATAACAVAGGWSLTHGQNTTGKWFASAGLLLTIAGLLQLEVSGLFQKIIDAYSDTKKFPYGPPSHITREIIDNPDTPVRTWLRNALFFNLRTGFWMIVAGTMVQVVAVWL